MSQWKCAERVREGMLFFIVPNFPSTFPSLQPISYDPNKGSSRASAHIFLRLQISTVPAQDVWFYAAVIGAAFTRMAHEKEEIK